MTTLPGTNTSDPGWRPAMAGLLPFANLTLRTSTGDRNNNGLIVTRRLFVAFVMTFMLTGAIAAATAPKVTRSVDATLMALVVVAVGVTGQIVARVLSRPLRIENAAALGGSYRSRFLLRVACSEASVLAGFAGVLITGNVGLYLLGAAFTLAGCVWFAPTRANLERDQRDLDSRGSRFDLSAALQHAA